MIQLDFFQDDETVRLRNDFLQLKDSSDKVRRKLFAENGKLRLECQELRERLEILERNICTGNLICQSK